MYKKYFVWNFDDGLEQDKKIIEILKEFGMGATFNLNSGLYGDKTMIGRVGDMGFYEVPPHQYDLKKRHLLKYVPHFRIPEDELLQVYEGFEIASHTLTHKNLKKISSAEAEREITEDVANLTSKFQQEITGFAYPYGMRNDNVLSILKQCGITYARTASAAKSFSFPQDPMVTNLTCWHILPKTFSTLDRFFNAEAETEDLFFLMFAHGYEFDFNTKNSSWDQLKRICESVAAHDDIICCSTGEAIREHIAQKRN